MLGLFGMGLNRHGYQFDFNANTIHFGLGFILPLIISLAWGWRYGLLTMAFTIGWQGIRFAQAPMPERLVVVQLLIQATWIVCHGWCAQRRRAGRFPHYNVYLIELTFRVFAALILYAVWGVYFFVSHFQSASAAAFWPMIHFIVTAQAIRGFIVLLIAQTLLRLGIVKRVLGHEQHISHLSATGYIIGISILFGLLFWIVDGIVDYMQFQEQLRFLMFKGPQSLMGALLFNISTIDLFQRMIFIATCLIGGLLVSRLFQKHHEATQALQKSEKRFRRLHESMRDAFVQFDLEGHIVDFNPAFQQMLGYDATELMTLEERAFTPAKWHFREAHTVTEQILSQGKSDVHEKEYICKDGRIIPVELRVFLISDDEDRPTATWAIVRDITIRKKAEREREEMLEALQRSNEDLQQFAYVASHDLQEPLRMVSSYTHLLAERYRDRLDEKAKKFIDYAVEGAVRMQALIQDLLVYSRVDTRGAALTPVNAEQAVHKALANLRSLIDESGACITTNALPEVYADKSQLTMVLQNLIHNSIKFCKEKTPEIVISAIQKGCEWHFSVKDNGIGIDRKYKEKIFIIFQRLHTRTEYPGTGIGLAMCKKIIERHNGSIWFESKPGQGSTFFFSLEAVTKGDLEDVETQRHETCRDITCGG